MGTQTVRLATRGSSLAKRQAALVADRLETRRYDVELVTVETTGDQLRDELIHRLGKTGAFVRELDEQVLSGDVDAAVHSLKDVPTEQPPELVTAAIPERAHAADILVTPDGVTLESLPNGATVGTSSLRRRAQLLSVRPDLAVKPLRGNVDTRLEKLLAPSLQATRDAFEDGEALQDWLSDRSALEQAALERSVDTEYDAIVLAAAGLERADLLEAVPTVELSPEAFTPAPGQGALAVTALEGDLAESIHDIVGHPRSRVEVTVERIILAELGGGCIAPIGIHAILKGEYIRATVQVYDSDGKESVTGTRDLPVERHPEAARAFASDLADEGAAALIEAARNGDAGRTAEDDS